MSVLIVDDGARAQVARVLEYAKTHEYIPGEPAPGDNPNFVAQLTHFRCVFSFTRMPDNDLYRHLSISVPNKIKYPNPIAAFEIAELFGFTGRPTDPDKPGPDWMMNIHEADHCIVLAQQIAGGRLQ